MIRMVIVQTLTYDNGSKEINNDTDANNDNNYNNNSVAKIE